MSLSKKDFYFITNHSTMFRYFVDNSSGKPQRYLFYPEKYELMTSRQIIKYERNLVLKFLWWGLRNKDKMMPFDYQICTSKLIDFGLIAIGTLLLAKYSRKFLFKQEILGIENFMQQRNIDVRFWKALTAYSVSFTLGYLEIRNSLRENYLYDLAIEYSPNYIPRNELNMKEIQPLINKFHLARYPWLNGNEQA